MTNDDKQDKAAAEPPAGEGNSLEDASEEAVREMKKRAEGTGHAGAGDIG